MTAGDFVLGIGIIVLILFMFVIGVLVGADGRAVARLRDQPHRLPRPIYRPIISRPTTRRLRPQSGRLPRRPHAVGTVGAAGAAGAADDCRDDHGDDHGDGVGGGVA